MIESTLKIARYPLVIQGFSNFLGLFQGIMANPDHAPQWYNLQVQNHKSFNLTAEGLEILYQLIWAFFLIPVSQGNDH